MSHPGLANPRVECLLQRMLFTSTFVLALAGVATAAQVPVAFVSNTLSGSISVINTDRNAVLGTIALNATPRRMAVSNNRRFIYVATLAPDDVAVIDTTTQSVVATIGDVGSLPQAVAISPDGRTLYVADWGDNAVSVIDTVRGVVISRIPVGSGPSAIALTPGGQRAYVTNSASGDVTMISGGRTGASNTATIPVGAAPADVALTPDGNFAYVANSDSDSVSVISTNPSAPQFNTVIRVVAVGSSPASVAIANIPGRGLLAYIANLGSNRVSVINADAGSVGFNTVIDTIDDVGSLPAAIAITPRGDLAYVTNFVVTPDGAAADGFLSIIDTATDSVIPGRIPVGEFPVDIAIVSTNSLRLPTPLATATSTATDTPTITPTDTGTATISPTSTPTPTVTPTLTRPPTPFSGRCCTDEDCRLAFPFPDPSHVFCGSGPLVPPECSVDPTYCRFAPAPENCGFCNAPFNTPSPTPPTPPPSRTPTVPCPPVGGMNVCASTTKCVGYLGCYVTGGSCRFASAEFVCCPPTNPGCRPCAGDCDGSGKVESSERTTVTQIRFNQAPLAKCYAADINGDGVLSCGEFNLAISNFQTQGCQKSCVPTADCPC